MRNTFYRDDDHLAHHGVKGMKWGVRKSSSSGGTGRSRKTRKSRKSVKQTVRDLAVKGSVGLANMRQRELIEQSRGLRDNAARIEQLRQAKSLGDIASINLGNKRSARVSRVSADMYDDMAKYSNTKRSQRRYKAAAENSRTFANYYDRLSNKRGKDKAIEMLTGKEAYSLPWKRANGKTITYGRHVAEELVNNLVWSAAKTYAQKTINDELKRRSAQRAASSNQS